MNLLTSFFLFLCSAYFFFYSDFTMQSSMILLLSLPIITNAANFRSLMNPDEATKNECQQHTLCSSCLEESDCVWCADGSGSCVAGTIDNGPANDGTCKDWESSYCLHEPCAAYSQCSTCTSDAFCGWSGSESVCVEGDSEGPLTGKDRDGKWIWSECHATAATGSSGTGAGADATGSADEEAAESMKSAEGSVEKLHKGEEKAIQEEKTMVGDEKKAFNVIKHLKAVINACK